MGIWRPPSTQLERSTRAIRSMSSGTLDGRVVSALPIGGLFGSGNESDAAGIFGPTILPYTDHFQPTTSVNPQFRLTYLPYAPVGTSGNTLTFHVYWNNVFQKESSYTLNNNLLTLTDPSQLIRTGDTITVKYWYNSESLGENEELPFDAAYVNGPPDFYTQDTGGYGPSPLLTHSEMEAVATPEWLAVMNGITASNGTIIFQSANLFDFAFGPTNEIFPVWMIPNQKGRSFRIAFDNVTVDGLPPEAYQDEFDYYNPFDLYASMQNADSGPAENLSVGEATVRLRTGDNQVSWKMWYGYYYYDDNGSYEIQNSPMRSRIVSGSEGLEMDYISLFFNFPMENYESLYPWTDDMVVTVTGLRVEWL